MSQLHVHPATPAAEPALQTSLDFETSDPHTLSVVDMGWRHPSGWRWWAYYGPQLDGWIGLATSHDLRSWSKQPAPVMQGNRLRWPSVVRTSRGLHMLVGDDVEGLRGIARYSSPDGLIWGARETVVPGIDDGGGQGNPFIFHDATRGGYVLWYFRRPLPHPGTYQLRYRRARTLEGLATAEDHLGLEAEHVLAAPGLAHFGMSYWLYTEEMDGGKESSPWRTYVRRGPTATGPWAAPQLVSGADEGCPFPHVFGDRMYLFTCRRRKPVWDVVARAVGV